MKSKGIRRSFNKDKIISDAQEQAEKMIEETTAYH